MAESKTQSGAAPERAARFRPTIWARVHYLFWTILIFALWPIAMLFELIKKIRSHE